MKAWRCYSQLNGNGFLPKKPAPLSTENSNLASQLQLGSAAGSGLSLNPMGGRGVRLSLRFWGTEGAGSAAGCAWGRSTAARSPAAVVQRQPREGRSSLSPRPGCWGNAVGLGEPKGEVLGCVPRASPLAQAPGGPPKRAGGQKAVLASLRGRKAGMHGGMHRFPRCAAGEAGLEQVGESGAVLPPLRSFHCPDSDVVYGSPRPLSRLH